MTAAEFAASLGALASRLQEIGPQAAETKAIIGTSLVVENIQKNGIGKYSTQRLPDWYFSDKELNAGGRAYLSQKETEKDKSKQGVTWGEFRAAQGLQNSYVDYTYSGRTLGGLVIVESGATASTFYASTGGSDKEVDKKLGYGIARYGAAAFQPTAAIAKEVDAAVLDILEDFIRRVTGEATT